MFNDDFFKEFKEFNMLFNNFSRPVKDMQPYNVYKTDKGFIIVVNTLGMSKDDLTIEIINEKGRPYPTLKVTGKTSMPKINFENSVSVGISLNINQEISDFAYEVKDGLTIIYLKLKDGDRKALMAKYISNPDEFDF